MAANTVNFFQPGTEAAIDANSIMRQRELAKLLTQQGMRPQEGQMVSGHYVAPGAASYVAQLASALLGRAAGDKADASEREMGQRLQAQRAAESQAFMQAMQGTPASTREVEGPAAPGQAAPTQTIAAVPGDTNRAMALALQSQNPALQGMGGELMKRQLDAAELQQALAAAGLGAPSAPGIAGAPGAPVQAGFPAGVNPQAAALTLSRNPQANKLGAMFQEASKPQVLAEGGTLFNPATGQPMFTAPKTEAGINVQGGRAVPIPGFAEAQAGREGQIARERQAAESANTMVTVDINGKPTQMTRQQFLELSGGGRPQQAPPAAQPPVRTGGPGVRGSFEGTAEQILATIDAAPVSPAVKQEMRQAYTNQVTGNNPAFNAMGTGALPPQEAGAGRGSMGGPGIVGQTGGEKAYETERAKGFAELAQTVQKTGATGSSMLRDLDQLKTLYADPNVAKGALAENISGLKNIGASFGVEMKGLSSEQAAQAITNKMALQARSAPDGGMPGAMSDADRNFLKNLQPDLSKTPEGRAKIIDAMQKTAQRQIDIAQLANQYEQQNGRLDAGFDKVVRDYASKNQLFTEPTKGGGSKTQIQELLKKYPGR